ncbi:MAG: M23 family metallopeptidase [bacterium]|nr:M23 family metallopeptidase [Candidatus Kapabacteria bacterium]
MTLRRRITTALSVLSFIGIAICIVWLAVGGSDDTKSNAGLDTTSHADGSKARDTSLRAVPFDDVVPGTPPEDTLKLDPPKAQTPDPEVLTGPLIDSSVAFVERDLDDREFVIPVRGVRPDQLIDTYTASRSEGRVHNAIDIIAAGGTPVVAVTSGIVLKLFQSERGGITLYLLDPDGRTVYYYAHLERYADNIIEGKSVRQGELIGYVGDTGNAGPGNTHLHFEITIVEKPSKFWSGTPVNPYPLLRRR